MDSIKTPDERFEENNKLATTISKAVFSHLIPFCQIEEIIQWGLIGLWDACIRYSGPENEFQYYARFRIKGQIIDELRRSNSFIRRLSKEDQPKFTDIFEIQLPYEKSHIDDMANARQQLRRFFDIMPMVLTTREVEVINWYCFEEYTVTEIAKKLNLSVPRVFQIKTEALKKMLSSVNLDTII